MPSSSSVSKSKRKRRAEPPPELEDTEEMALDHDDTCPICQLILYKPVKTRCNHTLCESCMAHWADVSINTAMTTLGLDVDEPIILTPNEIETRCPMCRTPTIARLDSNRENELKSRYPKTYAQREAEFAAEAEGDTGALIETLTLYLGNEHKQVRTEEDDDGARTRNNHEWKFFVRPSRTGIIEEVQVFLHPTFRNPQIIIQHPPYEIRRLGWGIFTINVNIILRAGYSWVSPDAEDTIDGGKKGKLPLEWTLDFNGRGSQGRCRLKVKREKGGDVHDVDEDEERAREDFRRMWRRQWRGDPDYVPPASPPP